MIVGDREDVEDVIRLARQDWVWFDGPSVFRYKHNGLAAAARGLAGVLAGALLLIEILGGSGRFHQALHSNGKAPSSSCLLCLFAKGQVDLAQPAMVGTASVKTPFHIRLLRESIALMDFTYLAAPSRAPPAFRLLLPAVA